jgi:DNA polymerase-3 subunit epsilon
MTGWADGPLLGLDLETDSPDPEDAHLITAGMMHYVPGHPPTRYSWVAQPTREIPEQAAKIHGYTTERAKEEGQPIGEAIERVADKLGELWSRSCVLICCNSPFDLTIVDRELGRHRDAALDLAGRPVVDIYLIDRAGDPWRSGKRTLAHLCEHYGVPLTAAHDSSADIHATMRIAWLQGRRHYSRNPWPVGATGTPTADEMEAWSVLSSGDPMRLHEAQVRWFRTKALELAAFWRTPKAIEKIEADHAAGLTTRDEADELIRTLPQRADDVERNADGWPMRERT